MYLFQDFFPTVTKRGFFTTSFEPLRAAMFRANEWVDKYGVNVINIETVVLPNLHARGEGGSEDPSLRTSGEMQSQWHQFIRVWYEHETEPTSE